jgi:hypothetical protein
VTSLHAVPHAIRCPSDVCASPQVTPSIQALARAPIVPPPTL